MEIHVRLYEPRDRYDCQRIFVDGQRVHQNDMRYALAALRTDMADITGHFLTPPLSGFWVAVERPLGSSDSAHDRVVGTAALRPLKVGDPDVYRAIHKLPPEKRPFDPDTCGEINRMCVDASMRRHGIARRLLHEMVRFSARHGLTTLHLSTLQHMLSAVGLYRSFGFHLYHTVRISTSRRAVASDDAHDGAHDDVHAQTTTSCSSDMTLTDPRCAQLMEEVTREAAIAAEASDRTAALPPPSEDELIVVGARFEHTAEQVRELLQPTSRVPTLPPLELSRWALQYGIYHVVCFMLPVKCVSSDVPVESQQQQS